ncbi:MAG TPA: hypothetical protein VMT52_15445 [Planctomycetota bacterium]|nr:hypothetical protein [Planctomycetota bacterium]
MDRGTEGLSAKDAYSTAVQLTLRAESISWDRFYSYLTGNSLLILAWVTLFPSSSTESSHRGQALLTLSVICLLGLAGGIIWSALGHRGRRYYRAFRSAAIALEDLSERPDVKWPLTAVHKGTAAFPFPWAGSQRVLVLSPLVFSCFYGALLFVPLGFQVCPWLPPEASGLVIVTVLATTYILLWTFRKRLARAARNREKLRLARFLEAIVENRTEGP